MKKVLLACSLFGGLTFLISCGGGESGAEKQTTSTETDTYIAEEPVSPYDPSKIDPNAPVMEISLEAVGNSMDVMAFSTNEIRVKSGTTVKLSFINKASDAAMKHNFFIVKNGTAETVATASLTAGPDKSYIPDDKTKILFTSKVLEPGQSEVLIFAAPPAGTYQFVCTYPGHWQKMNGKFIVE